MGGVLPSLFKVSTFCASLNKSQISIGGVLSSLFKVSTICASLPKYQISMGDVSPKPQINHKSNTKMTISSDIGSVLHQPCAVPGLLQSRFAIFRSIIFQILNEEQSFSFKISLDLYRSLWTAVRGCNSEFGLFQLTLRVLSGPPTPYQALMLTTKTTEYKGANGWDHFHFQNFCSKKLK